MLRLALDARPDAVLVTDAVATVAPVEERDGAAYLPDGTLAGSTLTMADAVQRRRRARRRARGRGAVRDRQRGAGDRRGRLRTDRARRRADLLALDPDTLAVRAVWIGGASVGEDRSSNGASSVRGMEIVAALFVEGIDFRQVAGPSTRIDITGAFFSTAVESYPAKLEPHLVVLVRAAGRHRRQRHARDRVPRGAARRSGATARRSSSSRASSDTAW